MSVPAPQRKKPPPQFLTTARSLERETRRRCVNGPKRYTFFGLQELWQTSRKIHSAAKRANTIWPTNQHEARTRIDLLIEALTYLEDYDSQLELLMEDDIFTAAGSKVISDLMKDDIKLVKGAIKTDRARYKELPQ